MTDYDVVVVGARCAGAPLAMLLAWRGLKVLAVDRARFPSDTMSTHFMWPRTTRYLARWGLLDRLKQTGCPAISTVTMHYGGVVLRGRPDECEGAGDMYCPRRTVLDALLVEAARKAGAEVREATVVRDLLWDDGRVCGVRAFDGEQQSCDMRAKIVVGADGRRSVVAALAGADTLQRAAPLTCGFYAYWRDVPTDGVEFRVQHGADNLVFPTHDGLTCVWAGRAADQWDAYRADVESGYFSTLHPDLAARVRAGARASGFRGTNDLQNFRRRASGPGWALVGDAAYHRDPLTGMGIGDAFLGATLLAEAIATEISDGGGAALADYEDKFRRETQHVFDYTLQSASLRDPGPQRRLYERIAGSPEATRAFMNVMAGALPAARFFNRDALDRLLQKDLAASA